MNGDSDSLKETPFVRWGIIGGIIIFGLWALSAYIILRRFPDPADHGTFGDLFGAINALFSGWAFLGVVLAIILQRQELAEQRKEINQSRIAQQQSAQALADQLRHAELRSTVDSLNLLVLSLQRTIERAPNTTVTERDHVRRLQLRLVDYEEQLARVIDRLIAEAPEED